MRTEIPRKYSIIRVLKGTDGKLVLGTVSFEADEDLDDYEIARGELPIFKLIQPKEKPGLHYLVRLQTEADLIKST